MKFTASFLFLLVSLVVPAYGDGGEVAKLFERLKSLEGKWRIAEPERSTKVQFEVIANGSALVERWDMSPTRSSMTVYSLDGDRLLVTHYCPQGNAPRLAYKEIRGNGVYHFQFQDGLNLQKDGAHQHAFWMRFDSENQFTRSETYIKNGSKFTPDEEEESPQIFERVE